jgi:glycine/D-amino acid oxidase-like deaminating enzyme
MDKAFVEWPQSLWREDSDVWNFPCVSPTSSFDIAIVGGGFSGLWTAFHLLSNQPELSIAIIDAQQPGFGASGRNGGWCSAFSPMSLQTIADKTNRESATALQMALVRSVDEIGDFISAQGLNCGWRKAGTLSLASNPAQLKRLTENVSSFREFDFDEDFISLLTPEEASRRVQVPGTLGATYSPHCAALHPGKLVDGLVKHLIRGGVQFFGSTVVEEIRPQRLTARTPQGEAQIQAKWIVRATEGFTARMRQYRRDSAPLYSYMIATEPLSSSQWDDIGWRNRETVSDGRNLLIYAQRTADDRIAFGGRGAPYKFASRIGYKFDTNASIHALIEQSMRDMFPSIGDSAVSHRWGGALGVHRDWFTSANVNHETHVATLGGYVGDGVAFSFVAAKEVALSISARQRVTAPLPIVNHVSPRWEPEPLRWIGINALLKLSSHADEVEKRTGKSHRFISWFLGKMIP